MIKFAVVLAVAALAGLTGCTRETVTSETVGPHAALGGPAVLPSVMTSNALGAGTLPGGQPSPGDINPVTGVRAGTSAGSSH